MTAITKKFGEQPTASTMNSTNQENFPCYSYKLEEETLGMLLNGGIGDTYYTDSDKIVEKARELYANMAKNNPEFFAKSLVYARKTGMMKTQPNIGLAYLLKANPKYFDMVFDAIITNPTDLEDFMVMLQKMGMGHGGRAFRRAAGRLLGNLSEYHAIKYMSNERGEQDKGFNLADAIRLCHPTPATTESGEALFYVLHGREEAKVRTKNVMGEVVLTSKRGVDYEVVPKIGAYERLKRAKTTDEQISCIREGRLSLRKVTGIVSNPKAEVWDALVQDMTLGELLHNLRGLENARFGITRSSLYGAATGGESVLEKNAEFIRRKLCDPENIRRAGLLPYKFMKAFNAVETPLAKDILREAIENSAATIPVLPGKTAILLDVSHSMIEEYSAKKGYMDISAMFTIAMYKRSDSFVYTFSESAYPLELSKHDSILSQMGKIMVRTATNQSAPLEQMMARGQYADNIIIITDGQQNAGRPFNAVLSEYRNRINRNAKCIIVDISQYGNALAPAKDGKTYTIFGWSDHVPRLIAKIVGGDEKNMVSEVNKTTFTKPTKDTRN